MKRKRRKEQEEKRRKIVEFSRMFKRELFRFLVPGPVWTDRSMGQKHRIQSQI